MWPCMTTIPKHGGRIDTLFATWIFLTCQKKKAPTSTEKQHREHFMVRSDENVTAPLNRRCTAPHDPEPWRHEERMHKVSAQIHSDAASIEVTRTTAEPSRIPRVTEEIIHFNGGQGLTGGHTQGGGKNLWLTVWASTVSSCLPSLFLQWSSTVVHQIVWVEPSDKAAYLRGCVRWIHVSLASVSCSSNRPSTHPPRWDKQKARRHPGGSRGACC